MTVEDVAEMLSDDFEIGYHGIRVANACSDSESFYVVYPKNRTSGKVFWTGDEAAREFVELVKREKENDHIRTN